MKKNKNLIFFMTLNLEQMSTIQLSELSGGKKKKAGRKPGTKNTRRSEPNPRRAKKVCSTKRENHGTKCPKALANDLAIGCKGKGRDGHTWVVKKVDKTSRKKKWVRVNPGNPCVGRPVKNGPSGNPQSLKVGTRRTSRADGKLYVVETHNGCRAWVLAKRQPAKNASAKKTTAASKKAGSKKRSSSKKATKKAPGKKSPGGRKPAAKKGPGRKKGSKAKKN